MKALASEKAKEGQRVAAGRDLLPLLADSLLADLLPAAGGREAEGGTEQFHLLIHSSWHSRSRRREGFSCEAARGKGTSGVFIMQQSAGFCSICPGPGAGQGLTNLSIAASESSFPGACLVISAEGGRCLCQAAAGKVLLRLGPYFCGVSRCVNPPTWREQ